VQALAQAARRAGLGTVEFFRQGEQDCFGLQR
jgi:hypothetical protein